MAKMTIEGVTYEGTPAELAEMVREFTTVGAEIKEASEDTTLKAGDRVRLLNGGDEYPLIDFEDGVIYEVTRLSYPHESGTRIRIESADGPGYATRDQLEKVTDGPTLTEKVDELDSRVTALEKGDDKPAYKTEKRAAKVGERILITDAVPVFRGQRYENGDVLTVKSLCNHAKDGNVRVDGVPEHICYREYEVIVEEASAKTAPAKEITHKGETYTLVSRKAQAGDIVVITGNTNGSGNKVGDIGKVGEKYKYSESLAVLVPGGPEKNVYTQLDEMRLATEAERAQYEKAVEDAKKPKLKEGDYVRVKDGADSAHGDITPGTIGKITDIGGYVWNDARVELLDGSDYDRFKFDDLELVDEKVVTFAKIGRKSNRYEKGDIARVFKSNGDIFVGVVYFGGILADGDCFGIETFEGKLEGAFSSQGDTAELIAPVESRVDKGSRSVA